MTITICGSMKFHDDMQKAKQQLETAGHKVQMPIKVKDVDYWAKDGSQRIAAKKKLNLISEHMQKIEKSDAILVINMTKGESENYIGANSFIEIGYAHYLKKKIFLLNPLPEQPYIVEELIATEPVVLHGNVAQIETTTHVN